MWWKRLLITKMWNSIKYLAFENGREGRGNEVKCLPFQTLVPTSVYDWGLGAVGFLSPDWPHANCALTWNINTVGDSELGKKCVSEVVSLYLWDVLIISVSFPESIKMCTRAAYFTWVLRKCRLAPVSHFHHSSLYAVHIYHLMLTLQSPYNWSLSLFFGALSPAWPLRTQRLWEKTGFVFSKDFAEVLISSFAKSYNQTVRGLLIFPPLPPPFWLLAPIISMVHKTHLVLWSITPLWAVLLAVGQRQLLLVPAR